MNGQGFGGDVERRYHQTWMGMAQPIEGLVVAIPVLEDAQCMQRLPVSAQSRFVLMAGRESPRVTDVPRFLREVLGFSDDDFATEFPEDLRLEIAEGHQTIQPTQGLRRRGPPPAKPEGLPDDSTPISRAAEGFALLIWELPPGLDLDKKEDTTGAWFYEPTAKFDRLLRAARVPIGLLFNGDCVRLVYAPHGETTGHLTFRFKDLVTSSGRPLFDAMVMLLHARRFFGVLPEHQLPALLDQSRRRQADVTEELADQVLEALGILLTGFETAAERDGSRALDEAFSRGEDHIYGGLLSTLLRLVFILYAEDQGLLPVDQEPYRDDLSVKALHEQLVEDASLYPDAMNRRFGAWPRLLALFRCIYLGASHDKLRMPARRGQLFDPDRFPFLGGGTSDDAGTNAPTPSIDDETVHQVLERLIFLKGQRLSFKSLDVEQIGSVYEGMMGFHVKRLTGAGLCLKPLRVWVSADDVLAQPAKRRAAWLGEEAGLDSKVVKDLSKALELAATQQMVLTALEPCRVRRTETQRPSQLVLQPGAERRRTSSHYTPRSLSAPIVRRALEPLLKTMGPQPSSERLLNLKICDPAMGSGAFLVESCRFLADQVVAAWTREGVLKRDKNEDEVMRARRLVAQRCLYGVDKNLWAVSLAKLSLWLVTLAKTEPFTFLDHALKCGDSLVGLDLDQIQAFHWAPANKKQSELPWALIKNALTRSLKKREEILQLALELEGPERKPLQLDLDPGRVKEGLLSEADAALASVKQVANACVGAFFAQGPDKEREKERVRRLDLIGTWLSKEKEGVLPPIPADIASFSSPPWTFHWPLEFPEVFHGSRPDPLDNEQTNTAAWMDGFVGNPPFLAGSDVSGTLGSSYLDWILKSFNPSNGNADICAYFIRRAGFLLGKHGALGMIATATITNGDSREVSLLPMTQSGFSITYATPSRKWPGKAKVNIVSLAMAIGSPQRYSQASFDGAPTLHINSHLKPKPELPSPKRLQSNKLLSYLGIKLTGEGFRISNEVAEKLLNNRANDQILKKYMRGETINDSPAQHPDGYVIDFTGKTLEEAKHWPELLSILEEHVRPQREKTNRKSRRENWWLFGETAMGLRRALQGLNTCIVTIRVPKHIAFSILPTDRAFNEKVVVIARSHPGILSTLQSRLHITWAKRHSIRYTPSDCLETFPLPHESELDLLRAIGTSLDADRRSYMIAKSAGLTTTYNLLNDTQESDTKTQTLRALHEDVDRAVLSAYGWSDIQVPPYCGATPKQLEVFEDEVLDRLFDLNERRAHEEAYPTSRRASKSRPQTA
ncbi:DNA methyltransferase, partial [Corallococcus exiguus]|uniref:DNA methyltransferase n=1 Tax=Corallococcus exiguus TaxID=83462 RepID=UPI0020B7DD4E